MDEVDSPDLPFSFEIVVDSDSVVATVCPLGDDDSDSVFTTVGCPLGDDVSDSVFTTVGCPLGDADSDSVFTTVGCPLGDDDSDSVFTTVGCPLLVPVIGSDNGLPVVNFGFCKVSSPDVNDIVKEGFGSSIS